MHELTELKEMINKELKTITKQESVTPQSLEAAYKAVDILKDIATIEAMQDAGYSNTNVYDDVSMRYSMAPHGYSYARGRDAMGRYTSRAYSRHAETEHMLSKLEMMAEETDDPAIKKCIEQCITRIEG